MATSTKEARKCIFCNENASSKGEHFWPVWMHEALRDLHGEIPDPRHDRLTIHERDGKIDRELGVRGRQGHLGTIKVRAVCSNCNNGWMNRLEEAARPVLERLIRAEPVALDCAQMHNVARWIALKCVVAEHSSHGVALTPRPEREALRQNLTVPPSYRIYLANYAGMKVYAGYRRKSVTIALTPDGPRPPLDSEVTKNVQTISFFLGRLFVHVTAARLDGFTLERKIIFPQFYASNGLWPLTDLEKVWPRRPLLGEEGLRMIIFSLDSYLNGSIINWN